MNLTDKVVVITGAGSGIGRALAVQLSQAGCRLALSDIDEQGLAETVAALSDPEKVKSDKLDVANKDAFFAYADDVVSHFGQADVIINNAGVAVSANVDECDIENYEWLLGINMWGVLYGTKAFLPYFKKADTGKIVNISSVFGLIAVPALSAYNMSKFAVRGLNEALWQELEGSNISCLSVHPGGIATKIAENARSAGEDGSEKISDISKVLDTTAESCAAQIIKAIKKDKRRILVGLDAKMMSLVQHLLPGSYYKILNFILKIKMR